MDSKFPFTAAWYHHKYPYFGTPGFLRFVVSSSGIIDDMVTANVKFVESQTAYTDGSTIYIPSSYISQEFIEMIAEIAHFDLGHQKEFAALSLYNGTLIHEALHILLTDFSRHKAVLPTGESNHLFGLCRNVVEDIYIENGGLYDPVITSLPGQKRFRFLREVSNFIFTKGRIQASIEKQNIIDLFICFRNINLHGFILEQMTEEVPAPFAATVTKLIDCIHDTIHGVVEDRYPIMLKAYEILVDFFGEDDSYKDKLSEMMEGDGSQSEQVNEFGGACEIEGAGELAESLNEEIEAEAERAARSKYLKEPPKNEEIEALREKLSYLEKLEGMFVNLDVLDERVMVRESCGSHDIKPADGFKSFGDQLLYLYEEKNTYARPQKTGTKVIKQRLHRIHTDGKVLAYPDTKKMSRGRPEIIVLVDASGSMIKMYHDVVCAAYSIFRSCVKSRIPISVHAHTTIYKGSEFTAYLEEPVLYSIAASNMPFISKNPRTTSNNARRFTKAACLELSENIDGVIIQKTAGMFTKRPGTKLMIVLSDGVPSGPGYSGTPASDHTRAVINEVRSKGIDVVALSLADSVIDKNDEIYGGDHNVDASTPKLLSKSLKSVLLKLVK